MALVDEYEFTASAGRGGDGVVRWRREKYRPKGGPCGGNGGKGGNFYVQGVRDIGILGKLNYKTTFRAEDGKPVADNSKTGADGDDYVLKLPVGSVVSHSENNTVLELLSEDEQVLLLEGGEGGLGNEHFKSSTNQRPMQATKGKEGEEGTYSVELRIIADVGLVGLPNAGKSSLLNALTAAGSKVGAYPFTTLEPNLGVYHGNVIADIPGLIEGASEDKGLGHKFLRHISRTSKILHCISAEGDNICNDYNMVRKELLNHGGLENIPEYVVVTKSDIATESQVQTKLAELSACVEGSVLGAVTILDDGSIKKFADTVFS